jgi:hypothetical protein
MNFNFHSAEPISGNLENLSSQEFTRIFMDCYTPITQSQFTLLAANNSAFFKDTRTNCQTNTVFTYGTQDASFVLMPLEEKYAKELLGYQS